MTALSCSVPPAAFARFTDAAAMGETWRGLLPALLDKPFEFSACNVQYARCRTYVNPASWHKSFLCVCYEFDVAPERGISHKPMLYGRAYLHGRSQPEFNALAQSDGARLVPELDMIVWNFPDDPRMPQLHQLLDVERAARHFPYPSLPFAAHAIVEIKIALVRYRPEQRCILRYDIDCGPNRGHFVLYAKVFADHTGEQALRRMRHCHDAADSLGVRIARPLGYSATVRTLWQEELTGTPLIEALDAGECDAPLAAIGHCLARLHATNLPMQTTVTREARLEDARKKSRKLAQMLPESGVALEVVIARGYSDLAVLPRAHLGVIHGDAHLGQFLITAEGALALFDFDEWSHGDPAQDLADLIVDAQVRRLERADTYLESIPSSRAARALLTGYRRDAAWSVTDAEIAWHARVQLINKAYRAAIQQEPRWRQKVPALVALAIRNFDPGAILEQEMTP
jgi:aminoglycoside phosphotransferase (APT) family kinase protein